MKFKRYFESEPLVRLAFLTAMAGILVFLMVTKVNATALNNNVVPIKADAIKITNTIYHVHTGGSGGGGCYTILQQGTKTVEIPCGGKLHYWSSGDVSQCQNCGASYFGNRGGEDCPHSTTREESYSYYTLGCNKNKDTVVGYVTYTIDTDKWANSVAVSIDIENIDMKLSENPYLKNGEAFENNTFTINENGTYTFGIQADENAGTVAASFTVNIKNIDNTSPNIKNYSITPKEWVKDGVNFNIDEVQDLQPDGSEGCGLHEKPYSYDNGESWETVPNHFYTQNGEYEVLVRDKLENVGKLPIKIENIDNEAPNIELFDYDGRKNIKSTELKVKCNDILSDGRVGCGLHEKPYSYDGGKTWTDNDTYPINNNCNIEFIVRDMLDNRCQKIVNITNLDNYMPTVSHILYPDFWTNGNVKVIFLVNDKNTDGTDGIGLENSCFSYDSGNMWTDENEIVAEDNCTVKVAVRDKNQNINFYSLDVINIDREAPTISVKKTLMENKKGAYLDAIGSDSKSGINDSSYVWSNGETGNKIFVTKNGLYTVSVKDKAGNSSSAYINVEGINENIVRKIIDVVTIDDDKAVQKEEKTKLLPNIEAKKPNADKKLSVEIRKKDNNFFENVWEWLKNWWDKLTDTQKFIIGVIAISLISGICLLLYCLIRCAKVYYDKGDEEYVYLGKEFILFKEGQYKLDLSINKWDKATTTSFKFKLTYIFVLLHRKADVYIYFPNGKYCCKPIARYIFAEVRQGE